MFWCLAAAAVLAQAGPEAAGPDPAVAPLPAIPAAPARTAPADVWYGLPALVTDGVSLALLASGLGVTNRAPLLLGVAGYLVGAPVNHVINRRPGRAVGSFFLRQVAAAVAVGIPFVSYALQGCDSDGSVAKSCDLGPALVAGGLVLAGAALIDDLLIAHPTPRAPAPERVSFRPGLVIAPNLGMVSLGGAF